MNFVKFLRTSFFTEHFRWLLLLVYTAYCQKQPPGVRMFCKKSLNTCVEVFFNKVAGLQACDFVKKRLQHRCFPVKFTKFLRTPFLKYICQRLLLYCTLTTHWYLSVLLYIVFNTFFSSLQLLLLITLVFAFDSNSKGFKKFKSSISFSLKSLSYRCICFLHVFSVFHSFVSFFIAAANKKNSFIKGLICNLVQMKLNCEF